MCYQPRASLVPTNCELAVIPTLLLMEEFPLRLAADPPVGNYKPFYLLRGFQMLPVIKKLVEISHPLMTTILHTLI